MERPYNGDFTVVLLELPLTTETKHLHCPTDFQCQLGSEHYCLQHNQSNHLYALHPGTTEELARTRFHESGVL